VRRAGRWLGLFLLAFLALPDPVLSLEEEEIPLSDWMVSHAERLHSLLPFRKIDLWSRPFTRGELAREVIRARARIEGGGEHSLADGYLLELEHELAPEIAAILARERTPKAVTVRGDFDGAVRSDENGAVRGRLLGDLAVRIAPRLFWHQRIEIDSKGEDDPDFRGRGWKQGITGTFTHAYAVLRVRSFRLTAGRRQIRWGNGLDGTLLLQGGHPSFDQIGAEVRWGPLDGYAFVAPLDPLPLEEGSEARRFLSAHRITARLGERLRVGLSETVLYGGEGRNLDWAYTNPLLVYYGVQWNRRRDDNVLWSADAYLRLHRSADLFGELLVDDFQYDMETEPNQIGFLFGVRLKSLPRLPGLFVDAEYVRVNNWVYGHDQNWNRYTYGNVLLGHPIGPDGDRFLLRLLERLDPRWEVGFDWEHRRKGEGRVDDDRESAVPDGTAFLTGDVRESDRFGLQIRFAPRPDRRLFLRVERDDLEEWSTRAGVLLRFATTRSS